MYISSMCKVPRFCGVKCSLCCTMISAWGTVHLGIMGLMFFVKSVSLIEACEPETKGPPSVVLEEIHERYAANALRCGIASGLYLLTFIISIVQFCVNMKRPKQEKIDAKKRKEMQRREKRRQRKMSADDFDEEFSSPRKRKASRMVKGRSEEEPAKKPKHGILSQKHVEPAPTSDDMNDERRPSEASAPRSRATSAEP